MVNNTVKKYELINNLNEKKTIIEESINNILLALGEDIHREGLIETPKRVAEMYLEVFQGITLSNQKIAEMYNKCFSISSSEIVIVKDIPTFSYCEHHMALMFNMSISVGYIPNKKVIGLSKIARISELVCKRLQIQERIGKDIFEVLNIILDTDDIIVKIDSEHSCMRSRGVKVGNSMTTTYYCGGLFKEETERRKEFFNLCQTK
ncbi:GTP cyclohydrolase I FolE [Enterococcus sp. ALS3]|uniref:GTP cyclohydrolase 1 n=1 Tax=Enterococcus alishanensis TaxID=1303817 RepID=A0ABS6THS9_9ENTE|nr:GTP cyclohydrolase I FolE [Enterococcus alishanensis]MBV7392474.1 GTP cyclohydrolase I FolE [Enterococcus alishanensis]